MPSAWAPEAGAVAAQGLVVPGDCTPQVLFVFDPEIPWTAARQASLSFTSPQGLLRLVIC